MAKKVLCQGRNLPLHSEYQNALDWLVDVFESELSDEWEIYVRPFLNGDLPDLVLLHPNKGLMIWEVCLKQDRPQAIHQWLKTVRNHIIDYYVPRWRQQINENRSLFGSVKCGMMVPHMDADDARSELLDKKDATHLQIIGKKEIRDPQRLRKQLPFFWSKSLFQDNPFREEILQQLRFWLNPPFHKFSNGIHYRLSPKQKDLVQIREGHHRVKGAAGSGKTLTLAHLAGLLASKDKNVLIVTYNISMWHNIQKILENIPENFDWKRITFTHFHGFCTSEEARMGMSQTNSESNEDYFLKVAPNKVRAGLNREKETLLKRPQFLYDAILIDEGQDFCQEWYALLSKHLIPDGQLLLAADYRQNIYGRDSWINRPMKDVEFRGRWKVLNESFRLRAKLSEELNRFAEEFTDISPEEKVEDVKVVSNISLFDQQNMIWVDLEDHGDAISYCLHAYDHLMARKIAASDITILDLFKKSHGLALTKAFQENGLMLDSIFSENEFVAKNWKNMLSIPKDLTRLSTVHSFKGWESHSVILLIPPGGQKGKEKEFFRLVYTGMSRAVENLIVINSCDTLRSFGRNWDRLAGIDQIQKPQKAQVLIHGWKEKPVGIDDFLWKVHQDFRAELTKRSRFCDLKPLQFKGSHIPDYSIPVLQKLYLLRYGAAYISQYYHLYERLYQMEGVPKEFRVLSIGNGADLDYYSLRSFLERHQELSFDYTGVDKTNWDYRSEFGHPGYRFHLQDVTQWGCLPYPHINILIFPASIGEFQEGTEFTRLCEAVKNTPFKSDQLFVCATARDTRAQEDESRLEEIVKHIQLGSGYSRKKDCYVKGENIPIGLGDQPISIPHEIQAGLHNLSENCPALKENACTGEEVCKTMDRNPILKRKYHHFRIIQLIRS